jgi:hypothetical protein
MTGPNRSFDDVEPAPENVKSWRFPSRLKKKSPLLTFGAPRRRSIFLVDLEAHTNAVTPILLNEPDAEEPSGTAKNYISCPGRRPPSSSERCAGLAAIDVVAGTVICLSKPTSTVVSPAWKASEGIPMRVSDPSMFRGAIAGRDSMDFINISYDSRQAGIPSKPAKSCPAEGGGFDRTTVTPLLANAIRGMGGIAPRTNQIGNGEFSDRPWNRVTHAGSRLGG